MIYVFNNGFNSWIFEYDENKKKPIGYHSSKEILKWQMLNIKEI